MLKVLKTLKWREWLYAAVAVGFIVLQVWLDLKMPDYMSQITQLAVMSDAANMPEIWKNGGLMLACALGSAISSVAVGFFCRAHRGVGILPPAQPRVRQGRGFFDGGDQ